MKSIETKSAARYSSVTVFRKEAALSTRLKTRSDYHDGFSPQSVGLSGIGRWFKPLLWLSVGLMLGMLYNKKDLHSCYNLLAAAENQKQPVVAKSDQKIVKHDLAVRA